MFETLSGPRCLFTAVILICLDCILLVPFQSPKWLSLCSCTGLELKVVRGFHMLNEEIFAVLLSETFHLYNLYWMLSLNYFQLFTCICISFLRFFLFSNWRISSVSWKEMNSLMLIGNLEPNEVVLNCWDKFHFSLMFEPIQSLFLPFVFCGVEKNTFFFFPSMKLKLINFYLDCVYVS